MSCCNQSTVKERRPPIRLPLRIFVTAETPLTKILQTQIQWGLFEAPGKSRIPYKIFSFPHDEALTAYKNMMSSDMGPHIIFADSPAFINQIRKDEIDRKLSNKNIIIYVSENNSLSPPEVNDAKKNLTLTPPNLGNLLELSSIFLRYFPGKVIENPLSPPSLRSSQSSQDLPPNVKTDDPPLLVEDV